MLLKGLQDPWFSCRLESAFRERLCGFHTLLGHYKDMRGMASSKCLKHDMVFLQTLK